MRFRSENTLLGSDFGSQPSSVVQWRKLQRLLAYAYVHVPFYQRCFRSIGAEPGDIKTPLDFLAFPILTREDILEYAEEMLAFPKEKLVSRRSGSSTGHPLTIYMRKRDKSYRHVLWRRVDGWVNANFLWPSLAIGMYLAGNVPPIHRPWHRIKHPYYRYSFRQWNQELLCKLIQDIQWIKPARIHGYPSILLALAQYIQEHSIEMRHPPKVVTSYGETLYALDCELIGRAFCSPVYDRYASAENTMIAAECRARQGLHVLTDHVYLEILQGKRPADPGQPGHIILTDLDNLGMPCIRYRNEDIAAWAKHACCCGRSLPLLDTVLGRETTLLLSGDGAFSFPSNLMKPLYAIAKNGHIRQFQLRQATKGHLEILAVRGDNWREEDGLLVRQVSEEEFAGKMCVDVRWVSEIPAEPSGKVSFVKSEIPFTSDDRLVWRSRNP